MHGFPKCEGYFRNDCGELINVGAYCTVIFEDWIQGQGGSGIMDPKQPMGRWLIAQVGLGLVSQVSPARCVLELQELNKSGGESFSPLKCEINNSGF